MMKRDTTNMATTEMATTERDTTKIIGTGKDITK